jgi:O-antigen ligase
VAFKRWTKAVGDVVMVLVVLTETDPAAAVKRLLSRIGLLLIPLSVLFIKYYPELGRSYSPWNASPYYHGVAMGKNGLGYVCLIFGLASLWRVLEAVRSPDRRGRRGPLLAHGALLAMALWLLVKADSATSFVCLLIGAAAMTITSMPRLRSTSTPVHLVVGAVLFVWVSALVFDVGTDVVEAMGRDTTLTGRTGLWEEIVRMTVDPLFGAGFESFWLGTRLESFWRQYWWHPNQAHNGYLEVFLNLGAAGVVLLGGVMFWGYRNVVEAFRRDPATCGLRLAYFLVAVLYNFTEAAFKGFHLVWIALLLAIMTVPAPSPPQRP